MVKEDTADQSRGFEVVEGRTALTTGDKMGIPSPELRWWGQNWNMAVNVRQVTDEGFGKLCKALREDGKNVSQNNHQLVIRSYND